MEEQQINIDNNKPYSLFHHELLDRLYCIMEMYDALITKHEGDDEILSMDEKEQMALVLGDLYQMVGNRVCKSYGEDDNHEQQ